MELEFTVDPPLTGKLRAEIVACWTDVTNAGGSVGFVPPVTKDDVRAVAAKTFAGVDAGDDRLIVGRVPGLPGLRSMQGMPGFSESPGSGGVARLAAVAFITYDQFLLTKHWRTIKRVMVHPDFQGLGFGARLMAEVERVGRTMGLEQLVLDCRGGTGNDEFYKKCGYTEFGRLRGGLKLDHDDYRDRILMALAL